MSDIVSDASGYKKNWLKRDTKSVTKTAVRR